MNHKGCLQLILFLLLAPVMIPLFICLIIIGLI